MTMSQQGTDWIGRPLRDSGPTPADEAQLVRLEGMANPTGYDRNVLAALRVRTPNGSTLGRRVWALTEKWNAEFAAAKAATEDRADAKADDEARLLR